MLKTRFQEARWEEPILMEQGSRGERGILLPKAEPEVAQQVGPARNLVPVELLRKEPAKLPEISQMQLSRHYLRLSQETIGADLNIDIGLGTCTMKYNPKIHEVLVRREEMQELHPYQDDSTVQGILKILYETQEYLKAISGMDAFNLLAGGGTQAIYSNVQVMRAYHRANGEGEQRDEVITTILSHPGNPGAAATAGYKVITLFPDENGYPDLEALRKSVSPRTAGLMITNPEDTGLYNPRIKEYVDLVHSVGGLCIYDQANQNGLFGIARAREAGFDMCHYNLHKSFASPHGSQGPGCGAQGVVKKLEPFRPGPRLAFDGQRYYWTDPGDKSVGKIHKFYGVPQVALRAYACIRSLGAEGLRQVADLSILNNNYLLEKMTKIPGISLPLAPGVRRLEQARLSWEQLTKDTGVTSDDIDRRIVDYGFQSYFSSHHPQIIPEPFTPEAVETYSKADIDDYVQAMGAIAQEAYTDPELVKNAPYHGALASQIDTRYLTDPNLLITTWRAYCKQRKRQE